MTQIVSVVEGLKLTADIGNLNSYWEKNSFEV